jgi:hypothetical protein
MMGRLLKPNLKNLLPKLPELNFKYEFGIYYQLSVYITQIKGE